MIEQYATFTCTLHMNHVPCCNWLKVFDKNPDFENVTSDHKGQEIHFMVNPQKFMQVRISCVLIKVSD